jgi:Zn-dependent M28 family amino/carboxypeptidase
MNVIDTLKFICSPNKKERLNHIRHVVDTLGGFTVLEADDFSVNIVIPAKSAVTDKIVLTAHYDVFPGSCGYNDNGTGIVTLLEFYSRHHNEFPEDVEIVFTDHEEIGGLGARYYIGRHRGDILCNINVDVNGFGKKLFFENYGSFPFYLNRKDATPYDRVPFNDSHIFRNANVPSILLITGDDEKSLIGDIWNLQHGSADDNKLELISEKPILKTIEYIERLLI